MWLKLILKRDGSPLRLNSNLIEAYQEADGGGSILSTNDGGYEVKESLEEVDKMLGVKESLAIEIARNNWK